jgi:DNA-binding protein YbaB
MFDQAKMIKQAFDLKHKMSKVQKELKQQEIVINHGMVTITMNGEQHLVDVKITADEEQIRDLKKLQEDFKHAVNQGVADSQAIAQKAMQPLMGDMDLKGLLGGS